MSEERFLDIEHTLEKADEDLTRLTAEVRALERANAALQDENVKTKAMLRSLAEALGELPKIFAMRGAGHLDEAGTAANTKFRELVKDVWTKSQG